LTTEATHVLYSAYRTGNHLDCDYKYLSAGHAPESAPFIKRPAYRKGWEGILKTT
jgi:hypothetical protein